MQQSLRLILTLSLLAVLPLHVAAQTAAAPAKSETQAPAKATPATPPKSEAPAAPKSEAPAGPKSEAPATPKSEAQAHLDEAVKKLSEKLADIEKRVDVTRPTASSLNQLSGEVAPLVSESQTLVDRLTPRVAALKARLDEFGTKPDKGESPEITADRDGVQKQFADNDGLLKRTKALALKAQQDSNAIGKRQRTLFTNSLFQRSTSILSPPLWSTVVKETPGNIADVTRTARAWRDEFNRTLTGSRLLAFAALVGGVLLLYWPLSLLAKRVMRYEVNVKAPSQRHKVLVACWTAVSVSVLMVAVMYAVVFIFSFFETPDQRIMPLYSAMQLAVIRVAIATGLSRGILAPDRPKWRLVNLDEKVVGKLFRIIIGVAVIVSAVRIIEALNDVIYASLEFTVATRGIGALLVALSLTAALIDLGVDPDAEGDATPATHSQMRDLYGIVRGLAWTLIVVITGAVVVGYIPFGSFVTEQMTLVAATGAILYLLVRLADESCAYAFQPTSRLGRHLSHTVGLRRETLGQLSVILSGAARLALILVALLVVAAPWGVQSNDVSGNVTAIFFGFKVGDVTISLVGIAVAILIFVLVLAATHAVQSWLEDRYLPTTRLDSGLRNSIKTSLGYVGFVLALALSAANLGVDFQKLAIVAGALSVGIGFGLQSIVNNFVSGLILLWERAVRVGDWVVVGSDQGYVRKINVRSTEIETFDRAAVIVPNSNLVSGVVKNLMRTDRVGRINIDLVVHASADPEKVREVLIDIAREHDGIVSLPAPQVRFTDLTGASMSFTLFCFVADVESMARIKSDLYFEIYRQFRQNKFFDGPAAAPTNVTITGIERLEAILAAGTSVENKDIEPPRSRKTG